MPDKFVLHVVSHTHWDREWYQPFQRFRIRLVRLIDRLLGILAQDPSFRYFTLDGQTVILEDYLDIRPERRTELEAYVRSGRLLVGPWYVLPDEFLVSGEALIRNLLRGHRLARSFGSVMMVGYIPDPFGHISQMPQLLQGFSIQDAIFRRGLADEPLELYWVGPDGSRVFVSYLRDGYGNARLLPTEMPALLTRLAEIRSRIQNYAASHHLLLMNGDDHSEPQPELPALIVAANNQLHDAELVHSTLPLYLAAVKEELRLQETHGNLPTVFGELRRSKVHHVLPGVLSTRLWIKQRNSAVEHLLEGYAEPLTALTIALGLPGDLTAEAQRGLLRQAWTYLLHNQAHDSICGCSIDQVHREMVTRYDWAEAIAEDLAERNLRRLADAVQTRHLGGICALVVFNPTTHPRQDIVRTTVPLSGDPTHYVVRDAAGSPIPFEVVRLIQKPLAGLTLTRDDMRAILTTVSSGYIMDLSVREVRFVRQADRLHVDITLTDLGEPDMERVRDWLHEAQAMTEDPTIKTIDVNVYQAAETELALVTPVVPGLGYTTLSIHLGDTEVSAPLSSPDAWTINNDFLSVTADPITGTLALTDRRTGMIFHGLNHFVDGGDIGDEYNFCPPPKDTIVERPSFPPTITVECTPIRQSLRIAVTYRLPAHLSADRTARSDDMVDVPIVTIATLYRGIPRLDIHTEVDNRAEDHRLRVLFPTGIMTDHCASESTFDVINRPLTVPTGGDDWVEQPVPTFPQKAFTDVSDGQYGIMLANRGLPECEVMPPGNPYGPGATIALTLVRAVGWLSRSDFPTRRGEAGPTLPTPEAQCLGRLTADYALIPHRGGWPVAAPIAYAFARPVRAIATALHDGILPPLHALVTAQPEHMIITAAKPAEEGEGLIVRVWNMNAEESIAYLRVSRPVRCVQRVNLNEEVQGDPLTIGNDGFVAVAVRPWGLVTLRYEF